METPAEDAHLEQAFDDRVSEPEPEDDWDDPFAEGETDEFDDEEGDELDPVEAAWLAKLDELADEQQIALADQFDEGWRR